MDDKLATLQPSRPQGLRGAGLAPAPGLLRVFGAGGAIASALPFRAKALELGRGVEVPGEAADLGMSRRHARVHFDGQSFWAEDLGSKNGTFVDGRPLPAGAPREVRLVLRLGDSLFVPSADVNPLLTHGVTTAEGFVHGPLMQQRLAEVARAAEFGLSLHLRGESGTGKEGLARAFHERGPRRAGAFVPINCAAIPQGIAERLLFGARRGAFSGADADAQGYVQAADGGTLFLDEVAELDLDVQAKLLRVLETREVLALGACKSKKVDFGFCSASHRDLRRQVAAGRLREDLYFRLGRPEVVLPPLRRRPEEIPFLLEHEVRRASPRLGLHASLVEACLLRHWPGNVRELLVEARAAAHAALQQNAERVDLEHLSPDAGSAFELAAPTPAAAPSPAPTPPPRAAPSPHPAPLAALPPPRSAPPTPKAPRKLPSRAPPLEAEERARIEETLRQCGGNVTAAAQALGMHRTHLRRLIKRHGLVSLDETEAGEH